MATVSLKPSKNSTFSPPSPRPSWQALFLVANHLDTKTLAIASCVSKSWFQCLSSDHHWQSICTMQYPSLSTLKTNHPAVTYQHLYGLGHTAAKRRFQNPPKPLLSLKNLIFSINIRTKQNSHDVASIAVPGEDHQNCHGLFKFDIDADCHEFCKSMLEDGVRVTWNVVLKSWDGVFCMMDCEVKIGGGLHGGWLSKELPSPGCCSKEIGSGLVADLKLEFCSGGGMMRVSVGLLSMGSWRYVSVDDALRYLQHFLVVP